jgi:hypothetical protein
MFFRKKHPTEMQRREPPYTWEKPELRFQNLRVPVGIFMYGLQPVRPIVLPDPSVIGFTRRRAFSFEGRILTSNFRGARVEGEIAAERPDNIPETLAPGWKNVPDTLWGKGHISRVFEEFGGGYEWNFGLRCREEDYDEVVRIFSLGTGSARGWLNLDLTLTHPDLVEGDHDFWKTKWREGSLQVVSWELHSGAIREGYKPE